MLSRPRQEFGGPSRGQQGLAPDEATKAVERSDWARADYLKRFYGIDRELPVHYDLVFNTIGSR